MQNKIVHAAERKAFQTVLNGIVNKGQKKDVTEMADSLVNLMEKILGNSWKQESYDMLRSIATNPDSKWARYANHIIKDMDKKIVSTFLLNAAYEGGFRGYKTAQEAAEEHGCNIPWLVLMDPTSACNMHCTGCWAAEYGHSLSRELAFLAVHGTLHILGYDHMNEAEEQLMRDRQRTILERIGETR